MNSRKVCPIVLRERREGIQFLGFEHPLAGCQLVKGTIEPRENDEDAAHRELNEESGLCLEQTFKRIGVSEKIAPGQEWFFYEVMLPKSAERWSHHTEDDGGHEFRFFWSDLDRPLDDTWHEIFHRALDFYRDRIS
ncbi:MAG: NUDIX domain-containing protein [Roseibium sp.]|uniref:NUDIX domain-containing protein n=1 Tax=Roseibium sp. TaxID=1936156 RepID=UPI003297077F